MSVKNINKIFQVNLISVHRLIIKNAQLSLLVYYYIYEHGRFDKKIKNELVWSLGY